MRSTVSFSFRTLVAWIALVVSFAVFAPAISAQVNLQGVKGPITIGTGNVAGSSGIVNARDYRDDFGAALQAAIFALYPSGGGIIDVMAGSYEAKTHAVLSGIKVAIRFSPGATITVRHSGPVGVLYVYNTSGTSIDGGSFVVDTVANDQAVLKLENNFRTSIRNSIVRWSTPVDALTGVGGGSAANPMFGILAVNETEGIFDGVEIVPADGVIGMRDQSGQGNQWRSCKVSNGQAQGALSSLLVGANCVYGFDAYDSQFLILRDFRAWGLGTVVTSEVPAIVRWYGSGAEDEDGHSIIDSPHIELCHAKTYLKLEGTQGWVTIENANLGLANYGIGSLGDAAIKVTRSADRVVAQNVQINAETSTFTLASGSWTVTPNVGNQIITSGFANAANNGTWVVTSRTSSTIVTTKYDGSSSSLTTETGSGDETIKLGRNSTKVSITDGMIHNVCRSRATAEGLFFLSSGGLAIANGVNPGSITSGVSAAVNVTGTNTFAKASGTWSFTPSAGQWFRTADFTDAANNGNFKIVSATSSTIVVAETLVNESGTGNEQVIAAYPYEGSAVWVEYASDVDIRGLRVTDQRSHWGISIDSATARGVVVDDVTMNKGSGFGSVAPFRLPSVTIPGKGSGTGNIDDVEGIAFGGVWLKGWGATPVVWADGVVGIGLTATATSITETNAPFFPGLLGDNSADNVAAGVLTTADQLTMVRNLDK